MKKVVSLLIAAMLVLSCVAALADLSPKTKEAVERIKKLLS